MNDNKQVRKAISRDKLSDFLPYLAYDPEKMEFINTDHTFGCVFECLPLYFASNQSIDSMSAIIKQDYGKGAILQFILFADTNISKHCEQVRSGDIRRTPVTQKMNNHHSDFLQNLKNYQHKTKNNRLKNYRLFVALKTNKSLNDNTKLSLEEILTSAGLSPVKMNAGALLSVLRQFLNGAKYNSSHYDDNQVLSKQAILSNTSIEFDSDFIKINNEYINVMTPKAFPEESDGHGLTINNANEMMGAWQGGHSDLEQIPSRFLWSCNILLDRVDKEIKSKAFFAGLQRLSAKKGNNIAKRIDALTSALSGLNTDHYLRFMPSLVIFSQSKSELSVSTTRALRMWEKKGFLMQTERHIRHIMFLQSLPFGLYPGKKNKNIDILDRYFIASAKNIAVQLPIQADYLGFGYPVVPFVGRKAQVQGLDLFCKGANNHNFLCCAESGSGKSFFVNWMLVHYFAAGVKIRINDIGGSYKKIAKLLGGVYIDVAERKVNLNPFQAQHNLDKKYVKKSKTNYDEIDKQHDIETITLILGEMCYSSVEDGKLTPEEIGLLTHAVKHVVALGVVESCIDTVQDYLTNLDKYSTQGSIPRTLHDRAKELSFNLCEFSTKGEYGYLFNGVDENSWQDNSFVVLELESLSAKPALMKVVSLQIINMMTQEMYQGDRSEKKMAIFDEVAFMFNSSQRLRKVVEDGYRRARKYNGSFGTIFQSILDTKLFGPTGQVMNNNAAFKFFLESDDYQTALNEGLITLDEFTAKLLTNIKSNRPQYSEIFMDTPGGIGVSRLIAGPYGHAIATSDADEVSEIESYQQQGLSIEDALEKFAQKRGLEVAGV